jgi:hypothetical protein
LALPVGNVGVVAEGGIGEPIEPKRGKESVFGERALGLNVRVEETVWTPFTPKPSGSSGMGVGGVGVRGGAGMGRWEAMIAVLSWGFACVKWELLQEVQLLTWRRGGVVVPLAGRRVSAPPQMNEATLPILRVKLYFENIALPASKPVTL